MTNSKPELPRKFYNNIYKFAKLLPTAAPNMTLQTWAITQDNGGASFVDSVINPAVRQTRYWAKNLTQPGQRSERLRRRVKSYVGRGLITADQISQKCTRIYFKNKFTTFA